MKKVVSKLFVGALICLLSSTVFANEIEQPVDVVNYLDVQEVYEEFSTEERSTEEIIEYINNETEEFSTYINIDVNDILKESKILTTRASGDIEATYESAKMKTGTPGVTWGYKLQYIATPLSSGYGYKFKDVKECKVAYYKSYEQLATWCDSCIVSYTKTPTHSISSRGTSITIKVYLDFTVYYRVGILPSKNSYSETHSDTVSITNGII